MIYDRTFFADNPNKITIDSPIDAHLAWVAKKILLTPYKLQSQDIPGIPRPVHGAQHAGRVAVYIPIIANLYRKYGEFTLEKNKVDWVKLVQVAAIFHDSGREVDGEDKWDFDSAQNLFLYLTVTLNLTQDLAIMLWEIVVNKEYSPCGLYYEVNLVTTDGTIRWLGRMSSHPKSLLIKLLACADCLDIMRTQDIYDASFLDFYKDHVAGPKKNTALDDMAMVITQVRSLLNTQGDLKYRRDFNIRRKYESEPDTLYQLIVDDITSRCIPGTNKFYRPVLAKLYNGGALCALDQLLNLTISAERTDDIDPIAKGLYEGTIFARGIRTPAFGRKVDGEKWNKFSDSDTRVRETLVDCEIRKDHRTPELPTASGRLGKSGNPNRSTAFLGWGGTTYSPSGFLVFNNKLSNIKHVGQTILSTGYGKSKEIANSTQDEIEKHFNQLQTLIKMGGTGVFCDSYLATHNEVVLDINQSMIRGVYFTLDSNITNARTSTSDGFAIHPYHPILEAIYIKRSYYIKTSIVLPIYEYSAIHNFTERREYTASMIILLWKGLISYYLEHFDEMDFIPKSHDLSELKVRAMYHHNPYNDIPGPADANYEQSLKVEVDEVIRTVMKPYALFFAVGVNDLIEVNEILKTQNNSSNIHSSSMLNKILVSGRTILSFATSVEMLELLQIGIVPTSEDRTIMTQRLLTHAKRGGLAMVNKLISLGCDVNTTNAKGNTSLIIAARNRHTEVVNALLDAGADVNIENKFGISFFDYADEYTHPRAVAAVRSSEEGQGQYSTRFSLFSIEYGEDNVLPGEEHLMLKFK